MVSAFIVKKSGSTSSMQLEKGLEIPVSKSSEVLIKHSALGVNYFDLESIRGDHGAELPFVPGIEVVGVAEKVGLKARPRVAAGERVAYFSMGTGGFSEKSLVEVRHIVKIPDFIDDEQAAGGMLKGIMALILLRKVFFASKDAHLLVFNALGGIGHVLTHLASFYGCNVIGVVSKHNDIALAIDNGCKHALLYDDPDFQRQILHFTNNQGVNAAYDPINSKQTLKLAEHALDFFGVYIAYGQISGEHPKVNIKNIKQKSLYIVRPSMFHYCAREIDIQMSASIVFDMIQAGIIRPQIDKRYKFLDIPRACSDRENRKNKMSNIILF